MQRHTLSTSTHTATISDTRFAHTPAPRRRCPAATASLAALDTVLVACGSGGGDPRVPIAAEVLALVAIQDCDAGSQGDFFISLTLREEDAAGDRVVLDAVDDFLVQLESGEIVAIDEVFVEGEVSGGGTRVFLNVSYFENDPGGPQVSSGLGYAFDFLPGAQFWAVAGETDCLTPDSAGALFRDTVFLDDGAACEAQLAWALFEE